MVVKTPAYGGASEALRLRDVHQVSEMVSEGGPVVPSTPDSLGGGTVEQSRCDHVGYKVCFDCGKILT